MGLLLPRGGERGPVWEEAGAIGPGHVNAVKLLVVKSGTRANRARLDKERASGHVGTSSHHLWKVTKPGEAVPNINSSPWENRALFIDSQTFVAGRDYYSLLQVLLHIFASYWLRM